MKRSELINEVACALSKFQGSVEKIIHNKTVIKKNKDTGLSHSYTYADLDVIWDTIRVPLSDNGLSITQDVLTTAMNTLVVETTLMHSSGQWLQTNCPIIEPKEYGYVPMQTLGGLITYGRRYSISTILGLTTDPDNDANDSAEVKPKQQSKPAQTNNKTIPNSADDLKKIKAEDQVRLLTIAKQNNWKDDEVNDYLSSFIKVSMLKDLNMKQAKELAETLKTKTYLQATGAN